MEEVDRPGMWEGARSFHALFGYATLPAPLSVHQPRSPPNPVLLGFDGGFLT